MIVNNGLQSYQSLAEDNNIRKSKDLTSRLNGPEKNHDDPAAYNKELKKSMVDFEAMFLKMYLKEAKKSIPEGELFGDSIYDSFNEDVINDTLSGELARHGGVGMWKVLYDKYKKDDTKDFFPKTDTKE